MKKTILMLLLIAAVIVSGCASGESYVMKGYDFSKVRKIAIADVTGKITGEGAKNQVADYFVIQLLQKGYQPVERAQVRKLLKEQEFQAGDITGTIDAAKAGRILNVPAVLIVNIPQFGEDIIMTAKMIDVEDGSIVWAGSGEASTGKTLGTILGAAGGAIAGAEVAGDEEVIGAVAGGVLGGAAGYGLTPKNAEIAKKLIKKVTEKIPSPQ